MREVFRGRRFKVLSGEVVLPSGMSVVRDVVDFGESVVILPKHGDSIIMIRQYRPAVGKWIYELPAGVVEEGEDPVVTAERELVEETGYKPKRIDRLFSMYLSPGYSNEYMYSFLAWDLEYIGARPEEGEEIKVLKMGLDKVVNMIYTGEIIDAKTIATVLYYVYGKKDSLL